MADLVNTGPASASSLDRVGAMRAALVATIEAGIGEEPPIIMSALALCLADMIGNVAVTAGGSPEELLEAQIRLIRTRVWHTVSALQARMPIAGTGGRA